MKHFLPFRFCTQNSEFISHQHMQITSYWYDKLTAHIPNKYKHTYKLTNELTNQPTNHLHAVESFLKTQKLHS